MQVLLNVVVAVLLDQFISAMIRQGEEEKQRAMEEQARQRLSGVVDPLTRTLMSFEDDDDLNSRIDQVYDKLDVDKGACTCDLDPSGV